MVRWVTQPPVEIIPEKDFDSFVAAFAESCKGWEAPTSGGEDAQKWNKRLRTTKKVMERYGSEAQELNIAYMLTGNPVAILTAFEGSRGQTLVEALYAHPGQKDAGSILIEWLVNYLVGQNRSPSLSLASLNKESTEFYQRCGFIMDGVPERKGGGLMHLNPLTSDKWAPLTGQLRLKAYLETKTYAA